MTRSSDKLAPLIPELAPLLRMLGSGAEGEIVNTVRILRRKLAREGADMDAIVDRLEKPQTDLHRVFERGRAAGRAEMSTAAGGGSNVGQGVNGYGDDRQAPSGAFFVDAHHVRKRVLRKHRRPAAPPSEREAGRRTAKRGGVV
jgi:hypothetical protein